MITRLLVANRGEIARRIMTTCRALGIGTVAVYADADADAPHVAEADVAVRLPGSAPADTYLRADLLLAAAGRTGADAVHPGYGFLSENAAFARAVADAGLVWVGPPAAAIAAMGSKLRAKELVVAAGVPALPTLPADGPDSPDGPGAPAGSGFDFPLLVKASAGGGGRGMRVVRDAGSLAGAVASARREAAAAFGEDTVFCEPWLEPCRHVEVQVVADTHGRVVALGERECSIQRRHQKIVEETPSPAVGPVLRERLCRAAVAAAGAVGYTGAGTVEFLLAPDGRFFFLEMNTRLQVEHPVTECVTGLDLVRLQLEVAEGAPLGFDTPPAPRGHAIEARVYAEDPAAGWRPSTGVVSTVEVPGVVARFAPPAGHGVRLDSGVADGSTVGSHYDAMIGKVIAWAPDRPAAARMLAAALAGARLHGVTTNRDLLIRVLRHPDFLAGSTDTGFLDAHPEVTEPLLGAAGVRLAALAAALAGMAGRRAGARVLGMLPP
ncbi:MAG TPA: biotin carboxylase N-terminal domain-containing protein, partial [Mycobacteriales bacterium]|nr:biotin carboxylase N-terminal domain-containing protein [Mycobacteriales bacterium]